MPKNLMTDDLNRRLVACLQKEGRISHAELAERLGVSRPTVIDRIKRLEADGVISGYSANVSPEAVNKPCVAFVAVRFHSGGDDLAEDRFLQALEKEPDVLAAYSTAGADWLLLKVVAETPLDLHVRLRRIKGLGPHVTTRTTMVLKTYFEKIGPSPFTEVLAE
ncbi:Lrp/AsnC family transcriptional regulator [Mesoterricola sediminis]|uniref:AsnC family transcriptional regulator n=1 Tax=Mesoterricola sediminis TaxID=2927980 RepID=A0AA48GVE2_9BACT|nr:Lrp/AsnC family transcriptional regulator [Mesoterricola sediminis]BDU75105.1 AsnC family transcriptional regulator [Mesoterricola sediminis]